MNSGRLTARQKEEFYVQRRNADLRKQEHLNDVAKYFKTWDVKTSKYAFWTSPQYFQHSEEARVEAEKKEKKKQTLTERREKLKHILENEQKMFELEVKKLCRPGQAGWLPLNELQTINLELKRRSEESRRREAELLLYQRWKQEQPTLKDFERRQHLEFMKKCWIDQVKEREVTQEKQRVEEALRIKEEDLKRKEEDELKKIHEQKKKEEIKKLQDQIQLQMEAIKESVQNYKELEKQEVEERKLQAEIDEIITQRKLAEQKQANQHLVGCWTRQYQLKLQKRAKEVEEEIVQDEKMLARLKQELNQEAQARAHAREIAKKEMELALRDLQTQRQREVLRQKEYKLMFYEDSKRTWEIQERKWAQESQARDNLMREVLDAVKKQVEEKLNRNSARRSKALEDREQLLQHMNQMYQQCRECELDVKHAQEQYRSNLDQQVAEKTIEKTRKAQEEVEVERRRSQAEAAAGKRLAVEMENLEINSVNYRPQDFRRQRVVW